MRFLFRLCLVLPLVLAHYCGSVEHTAAAWEPMNAEVLLKRADSVEEHIRAAEVYADEALKRQDQSKESRTQSIASSGESSPGSRQGVTVLKNQLEQVTTYESPADGADVDEEELADVEIITLLGNVQIKDSARAQYRAAVDGQLLKSGATIKTGPGAYAELAFDEHDDNIVRVEENTTAIVVLKENEKIDLLKGEVFTLIRELPQGEAFEIRTPTAVIGARGTEWLTKFTGDSTEVEAYEDKPFIKTIDAVGKVGEEEILINPGYSTEIKRNERPREFHQLPPRREEHWQEMRQQIRKRAEDVREFRGRPERNKIPRPGRFEGESGGGPRQEGQKRETLPSGRSGKRPGQFGKGSPGGKTGGPNSAVQPTPEFREDPQEFQRQRMEEERDQQQPKGQAGPGSSPSQPSTTQRKAGPNLGPAKNPGGPGPQNKPVPNDPNRRREQSGPGQNRNTDMKQGKPQGGGAQNYQNKQKYQKNLPPTKPSGNKPPENNHPGNNPPGNNPPGNRP